MEVRNNYVDPPIMERFVSTDAFNHVFKVNGREVEVMLTRKPDLNTIDGQSIDDIAISDTDIKVGRSKICKVMKMLIQG